MVVVDVERGGDMSDTVSDTLTAIRNASVLGKPFVELRSIKLRVCIIDALKRAGYVWGYELVERSGVPVVSVALKYSETGQGAIRSISMVSKPGNRVFCKRDQIRFVLQGLGVSLMSTNKGIVTDREAREFGVGGEVICSVF